MSVVRSASVAAVLGIVLLGGTACATTVNGSPRAGGPVGPTTSGSSSPASTGASVPSFPATTSAPAAPTSTPSASTSAPGDLGDGSLTPGSSDALFVRTLRAIMSQADAKKLTANSLITLGHRACTDLGAGKSLLDIIDDMSASELSTYDRGVIIGAAAQLYCPQYKSRIPH